MVLVQMLYNYDCYAENAICCIDNVITTVKGFQGRSRSIANIIIIGCVEGSGGTVAQSVERATLGEEVPGSIPAVAACSLLVGSVSV